MSVKCGWASIGENGKATGGHTGDQTGKEVKVGVWYQFGQEYALRWKDREKAKEYCNIIKKLCNGNLVGYDQNERATLFNALKEVNWKCSKLSEKTETDCSALVGAAVNCVVGKAVVRSYIDTGNLESLLMATGLFNKLTGSKYTSKDDYLMAGDILNDPGHHVISVLENGIKAGVTRISENSKVAEPTLKRGCTGTQVKKLQKNLNELGFKDAAGKELKEDGVFGASTEEALKKFQKKNELTRDGIYGDKSYAKMSALIK